ncbi:hypothetical protein [Streptomyces atratus]|uniref:hypothetical protein n=1 Tax=Streptomyces atratus TaxID=1893 RepID=UPI0033BFC436
MSAAHAHRPGRPAPDPHRKWVHWTDGRYGQAAGTAEHAAASPRIAGATEAVAAEALAEAARARTVPDPQAAADALVRAAHGVGGNVGMVRPARLVEEAGRLRRSLTPRGPDAPVVAGP